MAVVRATYNTVKSRINKIRYLGIRVTLVFVQQFLLYTFKITVFELDNLIPPDSEVFFQLNWKISHDFKCGM